MEKFNIDYEKQQEIRDILEIAKAYCEEHIPNADGWSAQGLSNYLLKIEELQKGIGNSFVVGNFE